MKLNIGLEKENLIFKDNFEPRNFSKKELNKNMTLDFSNNQIELVSDVFCNVDDLLRQMYSILNSPILTNNKIWPLSMPGIDNYKISYDALGGEAFTYREELAQKHSLNSMNISGIHFNVSLKKDIKDEEEYYFDLMKKLYVYAPIILQFVSYSPFYQEGILDENLEFVGLNKGLKNAISLRNSTKYGYINEDIYNFDYSNYKSYIKSIEKMIKNKTIISKKEIYSKIRLKKNNNKAYLELRFIDLNPYIRLGISSDILSFLELVIKYIDNLKIDNINMNLNNENFEKVALNGQNKDLKLNINFKEDTLFNHTMELLNNILKMDLNKKEKFIIKNLMKKYKENETDLDLFLKEIKENNLTVKEFGKKHAFSKEIYEDILSDKNMELSTKILIEEAKKKLYEVDILDEYSNVISISDGNKKELVVQATKTNKDMYANILMLENKYMTKKILDEANINVPYGKTITSIKEVDYNVFKEKKMVIKPLDTNFGLGISILEITEDKKQIDKALELAFSYSDKIIVEEFFEGQEYRFLVIDDELVSIVKRIPANVIGDGKSTIEELVREKNNSKLRGKDYKRPLEKMEIGDFENNFLALQNKDKFYVPEVNEIVYLRENSNISTGGDSEEVYDLMSDYFKEEAIKASKAMGVNICGVDMIISKDYQDYVIIEANFNPAIQMHTYPYFGIGKNVAKKVLDLLFK